MCPLKLEGQGNLACLIHLSNLQWQESDWGNRVQAIVVSSPGTESLRCAFHICWCETWASKRQSRLRCCARASWRGKETPAKSYWRNCWGSQEMKTKWSPQRALSSTSKKPMGMILCDGGHGGMFSKTQAPLSGAMVKYTFTMSETVKNDPLCPFYLPSPHPTPH